MIIKGKNKYGIPHMVIAEIPSQEALYLTLKKLGYKGDELKHAKCLSHNQFPCYLHTRGLHDDDFDWTHGQNYAWVNQTSGLCNLPTEDWIHWMKENLEFEDAISLYMKLLDDHRTLRRKMSRVLSD